MSSIVLAASLKEAIAPRRPGEGAKQDDRGLRQARSTPSKDDRTHSKNDRCQVTSIRLFWFAVQLPGTLNAYLFEWLQFKKSHELGRR
jgi:hypothetical protein